MIVKDEADVIARCLASVKPLVSAWCIVDTGSTDATQAIVRETMAGLPGELHERPWIDFAHNRNEAIALARGAADYLLVIDADDTLAYPAGYALPDLTADAYKLLVDDSGTSYWRIHVFRGDRGYRYVGVLHEVLVGEGTRVEDRIESVVYRRMAGGRRSQDPEKYRKDAAVLESALAREPENARYVFYLAQSRRDAGEREAALAAYARRATMAGFEEETWYALLEVGKLRAQLGHDDAAVIDAYLRAFERRPSRAEPLVYCAAHLRERGRAAAAYPFARAAHAIPRPNDILFVDDSVYAWRAADELAIAAYWAGAYDEARTLNESLLAGATLPSSERPRVEKNLAFSRAKLARSAEG